MKIIDRFLSAFSLISRIPVKVKFSFDSSRLDFYLPLTGIVPGLLGFFIYGILSFFGKTTEGHAFMTAVVILIAQYFCFNLFHLDGLLDTADAFLGTVNREKRLEILKDPRIGVYGFFTGFVVLALKTALLAGLCPFIPAFPAVVFLYPVTGRFGAALIPCMAEPARSGGLGALLKDSRPGRCVLGLIAAGAMWFFVIWILVNAAALISAPRFNTAPMGESCLTAVLLTACTVGLALGTSFFYARLYRRGIGGYTGDALGAAVETSELLHLAAVFIVCIQPGQ
jgi:adenosylcobinamide-GDP ribazoletransferase